MDTQSKGEAVLLIVAQTLLPLTAATYGLAIRLNRLNRRFRQHTWRMKTYATFAEAMDAATHDFEFSEFLCNVQLSRVRRILGQNTSCERVIGKVPTAGISSSFIYHTRMGTTRP